MPLIHPCADDIQVVRGEFTRMLEVGGGRSMSAKPI